MGRTPIPSNLAEWRDFVAYRPVPPSRLTLAEVSALAPAEKAAYDEEREVWNAGLHVIPTPALRTVREDVERGLRRMRLSQGRARTPWYVGVSGDAGVGKSTSVMQIAADHELAVRESTGRTGDPDFVPCIYLVTPEAITPKSFFVKLSTWLGGQPRSRATADEVADSVVADIKRLGTSLIVLDDIHNIRIASTTGAQSHTALKTFAGRVPASLILTGLRLTTNPFFHGDLGEQNAVRTRMTHMGHFRYGTASERDLFARVVRTVEKSLYLADHPVGTLDPDVLWDRTAGSLNTLIELVTEAALDVIEDGRERVTQRDVDRVRGDLGTDRKRQPKPTGGLTAKSVRTPAKPRKDTSAS